jgi:hypothetical protein
MEFKGTKNEWIANLSGTLSSVKSGSVNVSLMIGSERYYNEDDRNPKEESWLSYRNRTKSLRDDEASETEANAQLISAAPELLEALQHGLRLANILPNKESVGVKSFKRNAEKAINKALNK